jgi:hypothetical protein
MPQVFQVIKCVECQAFQVQLEKKSHKFSCTLCNAKQTLQKVYARSSKASDCRKVCQDYNAARIECDDEAPTNREPPKPELLLTATTNINNNNKWASWQDQDSSEGHENDFTLAPIPRNEQEQLTGRSRKKQKTTAQPVGGGDDQYDDLVAEDEAEKNYTDRSLHHNMPPPPPPPQMRQDTQTHHHRHRYNSANTTSMQHTEEGAMLNRTAKEASIVDPPPSQQKMDANRSMYEIDEFSNDIEEGAGKWGNFLVVEDDCF